MSQISYIILTYATFEYIFLIYKQRKTVKKVKTGRIIRMFNFYMKYKTYLCTNDELERNYDRNA